MLSDTTHASFRFFVEIISFDMMCLRLQAVACFERNISAYEYPTQTASVTLWLFLILQK